MWNLSIYIPWPFPPVWGVAGNTKEQQKQWGPHSVPLAMTRDPAEFRWHCWSNTAHPPPSPTTYIASQMPSPLLPLPQGCPAPIRQPRGNDRCQLELRHNHSPLIPIPSTLTCLPYIHSPIFTPSIHPNLGLPLALLPSTFAFITFFSSRSLSILST